MHGPIQQSTRGGFRLRWGSLTENENAPNESSEMVTHIQLNKGFSFPAHLRTGKLFRPKPPPAHRRLAATC